MNFATIDAQRERQGISQKDLCARANVNPTTYSQIKRAKRYGNARTYQKLRAALDELLAEKDAGHGVVAHARSDNDQRKESHGEV